jgi:hypothetical protein
MKYESYDMEDGVTQCLVQISGLVLWGERGCAFRSAASAAESAKCRMLQPAAQRAESRQPQPTAFWRVTIAWTSAI